ncbi:MAG: hypothetical protein FJW14_18035 [Acidimicrobiia bacterium]|nr:hypothetical protein [Acidimicrobiia bacterium]
MEGALRAASGQALTTRFLDFWLLGGASILVWLVMITLQGFRTSWAVDQHFANLTVTTASLALIVNYPHFLVSYKLAYSRGPRFIAAHWWQLLAVPALLVALFAAAYGYFDVPVDELAPVRAASDALGGYGVNAQLVAGPRLGDLLFTAAFNLMILTIGWHYTKQVFGCMMVYAHYDAYPLTKAQRALTKWALLSIWVMNFVYTNISGGFSAFGTFSYSALDLPDAAAPISQAAVGAGFVLVLHRVFYAVYRQTGRWPSAHMVAPFAALYIWWLPQTRQYEFYFLLVPLFHSLQYLPFAWRMEDARLRGLPHAPLRGTLIVIGVVAAGWIAFELLPNAMDTRLGTFDAWGMFFFVTAAMLFINIHHYFIDNVIWRFADAEVRTYLLGQRHGERSVSVGAIASPPAPRSAGQAPSA